MTHSCTNSCAPLTHSCVCSSRAECPCTHSCCVQKTGGALAHPCTHTCVCRTKGVRSHDHAHTHSCVSIDRATCPCTHTHVCAEPRACVGTPAHILMCVQQQGGMPLHTLMRCAEHGWRACTPSHTHMCVQTQGGAFSRPHTHSLMCVYRQGNMPLHTHTCVCRNKGVRWHARAHTHVRAHTLM